MTDRYKNKLKHAAWTWREEKVCPYHGPSIRKDRRNGRNDKRSAKQADNVEIEVELNPDLLLEIDCNDDE